MMVPPSAEHLLIFASAILFPPILFIILIVILLATFGKSFGLRQKYVNCLINIFEWGARQIHSNANEKNGILPDDDIALNSEASSAQDSLHNSTNTRRRQHSGAGIIHREATVDLGADDGSQQLVNSRGWAVIRDSIHFVRAGLEAIIEDDVTSRFEAEQLVTWNMLTRTSVSFYQFVNWKLTLLWGFGFVLRYAVLLPLRLVLFSIGLLFLIVSTAAIGLFPEGVFKKTLNEKCMLCCHRILSRSLSAVVNFHNVENKARSGGICVANHTSPIDVMILSTDNVYALVGQRQPGLLGVTQRALSRASSHIWFERSESKDRAYVTARLKEHVEDAEKLPILIFPEGTCINNTSVMMFKKGSFEVGTTIYPIAMKYDSRFGDAFWNSSEQGWFEYIVRMMTSWAIICNVWYLPPMTKQPGEDAIDFANRVKKQIAVCGGMVDLEWDGGLKRSKVPLKMVARQQQRYFERLSRYTSCSDSGNSSVSPSGEVFVPATTADSLLDLPENAVVCEDSEEEYVLAADSPVESLTPNVNAKCVQNAGFVDQSSEHGLLHDEDIEIESSSRSIDEIFEASSTQSSSSSSPADHCYSRSPASLPTALGDACREVALVDS